MAAPASHSTNTPASLTSRVMTEANRTAPDASFQVSRAGTADDCGVQTTRLTRSLTRFDVFSHGTLQGSKTVELFAVLQCTITLQVPRRICASLWQC